MLFVTTQNIKEPHAVQLSQRASGARLCALKDEKLVAEFRLYLTQWLDWVIVHHWAKGRARGDRTLSWRRHSFAEVWYACSRTPQAGSESIAGLHTVSQSTIRQTPGKELIAQAAALCLCTAQAGSVQAEFVRCLRFGVCT